MQKGAKNPIVAFSEAPPGTIWKRPKDLAKIDAVVFAAGS
jgi:hypothetical protein